MGQYRALYSLGNIYYTWGKHIGRLVRATQTLVDYPKEAKEKFHKAVECFLYVISTKFSSFLFSSCVKISESLSDRPAEGRACGNLGNAYYLLGEFETAVTYHNRVNYLLI